jgi:hypothetical protein
MCVQLNSAWLRFTRVPNGNWTALDAVDLINIELAFSWVEKVQYTLGEQKAQKRCIGDDRHLRGQTASSLPGVTGAVGRDLGWLNFLQYVSWIQKNWTNRLSEM